MTTPFQKSATFRRCVYIFEKIDKNALRMEIAENFCGPKKFFKRPLESLRERDKNLLPNWQMFSARGRDKFLAEQVYIRI